MQITSLSQLDFTLKYSYADYVLWKLNERVELIRGIIHKMAPAPSISHQRVLRDINHYFDHYFFNHTCEVFFAPSDVKLYNKKKSKLEDKEVITVVQPDLYVVCDTSIIDSQSCNGAPDLIVEILSPGNAAKDISMKYDLYEEAGVREYWVVNPMEKHINIYVLENNIFIGKRPIVEFEEINSFIFPDLKFKLSEIFRYN